MLFEIADRAHDLRSVEGVHLAGQDDEIGAECRPDQDIAIVAGSIDDDDVVAIESINRLGEGFLVRCAHQVYAPAG